MDTCKTKRVRREIQNLKKVKASSQKPNIIEVPKIKTKQGQPSV